ncbi:unnamed protein product [Colias eurytheme]|nr:unnamed protein product [Colias eurytheme]
MDNEFFDISTSLILQLGYGIGHILNDVCASLWFTYFLVFFHLVLEFTASQAGYLMLIGQVVDAVSTPFIGYHSDHTNNSVSAWYGRRKLWHLFGSACVLMSFPFIFSQCIGCSLTHKWAQIYGFTVFSNLFVYLITWAILHFTGQCDKEQVGPGDAWKFKQIMLIVLSIGTLATILFHFSITEKQARYAIAEDTQNATFHCSIFKKWLLYQVAGVYMCTRLVVNVSQVLIPLYLHRTLGLAARSLAVVPLAMYLGSLAAAGVQRLAPRSITRKLSYFIGSAFSLCGFVWIYFDTDYNFKVYFIYIVAVLIGFGGAQMLVTSLSLTADLVGENTQGSAFVYGLMSFTDKLSCGIAIALIQLYADQSGAMYYRYALSIVCGAACLLGLCFTVCLPKLTHNTLIVANDGSINASDQEVVPSGPEI